MVKFDIITIGDSAVDAFIRLKEAELNCDLNREACRICFKFASKIPYETVTEIPAGGNSANVALGTAKLGLRVSYLTNLGQDDHGQKILNKLQDKNIDTSLIKIHPDLATNYNYVLWYADDRTILVRHENYPYELPGLPQSDWIYLTSLAENSPKIYDPLKRFLQNNPETNLAFSPGTMQIRAGYEALIDFYKRTKVFFANKQEVMTILKTNNEKIEVLATELKKMGPKIVVITDADNGSFALDEKNFWHCPAFFPEEKLIERTGAGDAFASAFLVATKEGLPTDQALVWGAINSSSVVKKIGPHEGLLTKEEIKEYLVQNPKFQANNLTFSEGTF